MANSNWADFRDLGAVYAQYQQHHAAEFCFVEAIQLIAREEQAANNAGASREQQQLTLLYNIGLQRLLLGRHSDALACFRTCVPALPHQPLLWMRMAECMIDKHTSAAGSKISTSNAATTGQAAQATAGNGKDGNEAQHLLAEASLCLRTAQVLLDRALESQPAEHLKELQAVRQAVHVNSAHVELRQGNQLVALRHAETVLGEPSNVAVRMLAHSHAAEALSSVGRHQDALQHLTECSDSRGLDSDSVEGLSSTDHAADVDAVLANELNAASLQSQLGSAQRAGEAIQRVLKQQPTSQLALLISLQNKLLAGETASAMQMLMPPRDDSRV